MEDKSSARIKEVKKLLVSNELNLNDFKSKPLKTLYIQNQEIANNDVNKYIKEFIFPVAF